MNPATVHRLLDPGEASRLLACLAGVDAGTDIEIESVWAKPARHFNVCYRLGDARRPRLVSLCMVNDDEAARAARRIERAAASGTPTGFALAAGDVLAQDFPSDYRLEHLARCLEPGVADELLGEGAIEACEVAAYRAGMRCQVRFLAGGEARAYGKIAFDREPGRRARVHRQVFEATVAGALRLPAPLGTVDEVALDLVRAVDGRSLHDLLAESPVEAPVVATMRALAGLHRTAPAQADRVHACTDELALDRAWTGWMSLVEPALAARLDGVLSLLEATLPSSAPASFAHRDFHDKQVLFGRENLWLLDIDTACTGDPELDLGNFLAHLFLRGLQWERSDAHRRLEEAASAAYGAARRDATRWYRRASLLRLACVYFLRPRWRYLVPALLDEAASP